MIEVAMRATRRRVVAKGNKLKRVSIALKIDSIF